jgi:hypothetical protein
LQVFVVRHEQPRCTGTGDKVRLYKVILQAESSVASPQNLVYVAEQRVRPAVGAVTFDCQLFDDTVIGYCFKYVSIATSGAVTEQANLCLPTDPKLGEWKTAIAYRYEFTLCFRMMHCLNNASPAIDTSFYASM